MKYKIFNKFLLRTPLLSYNQFLKNISYKDIITLLSKRLIREAIFLASPSLHEKIEKEISNNNFSIKTLSSILKYISRMSTRCTPFGMFSGISVGEFSDVKNRSNIILDDRKTYTNDVQLDMDILFSIIQKINNIKVIRDNLKYFPNSTIYSGYNGDIKYIEYIYMYGKRNNLLTSVTGSYFLDLILEKASEGIKIDELIFILKNEDIEEDEANEFLNNLIDSQILVGELEPYVTGNNILEHILLKLEKYKGHIEVDNLHTKLNHICLLLKKISNLNSNENNFYHYQEIKNILKDIDINIDVNSKYLFQSNLMKPLKKNNLENYIKKDILKGIQILEQISIHEDNQFLEDFKRKFYSLYNDREISLVELMDSDIGIDIDDHDIRMQSSLLDDIYFPIKLNKNKCYSNYISDYFTYKMTEALFNKEKTIFLQEEDILYFMNKEKKDLNLPFSFSAVVEIYRNRDDLLYCLYGGSGSSAVNIMSRFCNSSTEINSIALDIIDKENQQIEDNYIFAEIVHLPESRVGNILLRPSLREYEIPYLSSSNLKPNNQILISDIYVSIKNNTIYLKSKKLNKYILPRLSSAHNYSNPFLLKTYRFLCQIQTQNIKNLIHFNYGDIIHNCIFLPRVQYKNIILFKSCWNLKRYHIDSLYSVSEENLLDKVNEWRNKFSIPSEVTIKDADNKLYINFNNITYIHLFLETLKYKNKFVLEEFLLNQYNSIVQDKEGCVYANEFVFSFYK